MEPLRIRVGDRDVVYDDPAKALADARRAKKMADELGREAENESPQITEKRRELRARSKALYDWSRRAADEGSAPAERKTEPAPPDEPPAGAASSRSRRQAAQALAATGVRRGSRAASTGRTRARKAVRRYEAVGGAQVTGIGEFLMFFFGSIVAAVLLEDLLSQSGSAGFLKASDYTTGLVHRLVAPVPLVAGVKAAAIPANPSPGSTTPAPVSGGKPPTAQ